MLLPIAWAAAGLIAAYLPFAFQRKMVMGTHLPLALLAGLAVADLARRLGERLSAPRRVPLLAGLLIAALSITSARWLVRDVVVGRTEGVTSTSVHPVYWPSPVIHAFEWLGRHTGPNAVLLAFPLNGVLAPAYSGRAVYAGHWGETPYFTERIAEAKAFYRGRWSSEERLTFLRWHHITHVLVSPQERLLIEQGSQQYSTRPVWQEPFLKPVFTEGDTTLYEVRGG